MRIPLLLLIVLFLTGCPNPVWIRKNTPLEGPRGGTLMFKNNPTRNAALEQAQEFCAPQVSYITQEGSELGGIDGFNVGARGAGIGSVKQEREGYITFVCVEPGTLPGKLEDKNKDNPEEKKKEEPAPAIKP